MMNWLDFDVAFQVASPMTRDQFLGRRLDAPDRYPLGVDSGRPRARRLSCYPCSRS